MQHRSEHHHAPTPVEVRPDPHAFTPQSPANSRVIIRFGERLAAELAALLERTPPRLHTSAGLSRWLGLNRGTCQRVLLAIRASGDGVEVLRKAPGVEGVADFVRAMRDRLGGGPEVDRAEAMVQDYALLVQRLGGSQAKLVRMAAATESEDDHFGNGSPRQAEFLNARREIYRATRLISGAWSAANIGVQAFRPSTDKPDLVDTAHARGFIGLRRRADGLPLSSLLVTLDEPSKLATLEGEAAKGRQWSALIAEFCSLPLPTVIAHADGPDVRSIILGDNAVERPVDIIMGGRGGGSQKRPQPGGLSHLSTKFGLRFPAKVQIYDFYVHKDISSGGRVFASALVLNPGEADPTRCWFDKLGYEIDVTPMGSGLVRAPAPAYPRMLELSSYLFSRVGWNADEFDAWRIELSYPTPGVVHTITLHPGGQH